MLGSSGLGFGFGSRAEAVAGFGRHGDVSHGQTSLCKAWWPFHKGPRKSLLNPKP